MLRRTDKISSNNYQSAEVLRKQSRNFFLAVRRMRKRIRIASTNLPRSASLPKVRCSPANLVGNSAPVVALFFYSNSGLPIRANARAFSEPLDSAYSVRFSKFDRFELLISIRGKRFGRFSR
jgi:hypothetical protein